MSGTPARAALSHLRVLDLSQSVAGAYCGKLLAGNGADVIKIEPPRTGDPMRAIGPFVDGKPDPERSLPFLWFHTRKRSVTLDLDSEPGKAWMRELVRASQIVLESSVPGGLSRLGLDFETLKAINPGVILVSVSPFGQSGPHASHHAEEITLYAVSGLMHSTGDPNRAPLAAGPALAHLSAGLKAYIGALMASMRCRRSGQPEWVEVSIQEAAADNLEIGVAEYLHSGRVHRRANDEHPLVPWRIFPCRDGHAAIMGGPIRHWLKAAEVFESPELVGPKYRHMEDRIRHRDDIRRLMAPWLLRNDKRDVFHTGQARGLAWGYLASLEDASASPQFRARDYFVRVDHPEAGTMEMAGAPWRAQRTPWAIGRAPCLGEHTEEVLRTLARAGEDALAQARQRGVI
jgi:crotonobetainyl-CoA:carnitine CoA-transferase CaiB-like acyl-CoA transferase